MSFDAPTGLIVIGGGMVGLCSALALAERGVPVTLIDRDPPGQGASMGNAGVISPFAVVPMALPGLWRNLPRWLADPLGPVALRPSHGLAFAPWAWRFFRAGRADRVARTSEAMAALNHDNTTLFRSLLAGTGQEHLVRDSSYVMAFRAGRKVDPESLENRLRRAAGGSVEIIDGPALREIEPAASDDFVGALLLSGQARALSPGAICKVIEGKLRGLGARVLREEVRALRPDGAGGWEVRTNAGHHRATKIVLAAGVWSAQLLAPLGVRLPLEAERGYHIAFPGAKVDINNSLMDLDLRLVASSMEGGVRAAGTAEFGGLDAKPSARRAAVLAEAARRAVPGLRGYDHEVWSGQRPSFPDSLPALGRIGTLPGLICAFGHSHWGFMMGPRSGRIVADLALDHEPNIDLAPYAPTRFAASA